MSRKIGNTVTVPDLREARRIFLVGFSIFTSEGPAGVWRRAVRSYRFRTTQRRVETQIGGETASIVPQSDLIASGPHIGSAREYAPSPVLYFDRAMKALPIDYPAYTFVDLGCGKGLPMMLAARLGFKKAIGVEFAVNVHQVALANIESFRERFSPRTTIEARLGDATQFDFPREPLVIYLFNPFGADVLKKVLDNLESSLLQTPRECWVVYMVPLHETVFAMFPSLKVFRESIGDKDEGACVIYNFAHSPSAL